MQTLRQTKSAAPTSQPSSLLTQITTILTQSHRSLSFLARLISTLGVSVSIRFTPGVNVCIAFTLGVSVGTDTAAMATYLSSPCWAQAGVAQTQGVGWRLREAMARNCDGGGGTMAMIRG